MLRPIYSHNIRTIIIVGCCLEQQYLTSHLFVTHWHMLRMPLCGMYFRYTMHNVMHIEHTIDNDCHKFVYFIRFAEEHNAKKLFPSAKFQKCIFHFWQYLFNFCLTKQVHKCLSVLFLFMSSIIVG